MPARLINIIMFFLPNTLKQPLFKRCIISDSPRALASSRSRRLHLGPLAQLSKAGAAHLRLSVVDRQAEIPKAKLTATYTADDRMIAVPRIESGGGVVWKKTRSKTSAKMTCTYIAIVPRPAVSRCSPVVIVICHVAHFSQYSSIHNDLQVLELAL